MGRWVRRLVMFACALLLLAAGLAAAGWLAFRAYAPGFTRERIEAALAEALGRPVRVDSVGLDPWAGRVVVSGIAVLPGAGSGGPELRLGRLSLRIGISSVWRGEVVLSRILLEDLALRIGPARGGAIPNSLRLPRRIALGPVTMSLERLDLARGSVVYRDEAQGLEIALRALEGSARFAADDLELSVKASDLCLRAGGTDLTFAAPEAEGRLEPDRIVLRRLNGRWHERPVRIAGEIRPLGRPIPVALTLEAEADLGRVARAAGIGVPLSGTATGRLQIAGALDDPTVSGTVTIPALTVAAWHARSVRLRGRWEGGALSIADARADAFGGTWRGDGTVMPSRPEATRMRIAFHNIAARDLDRVLPRPTGIAGRMSGEAALQGDVRRPESLAGSFAVEASALGLPPPFPPLGEGSLKAEGNLAAGAIALARATAKWPGLDLALQGGLDQDGPRGLRAEAVVDIARLAGLWGERRIVGRAGVALEASGPWDRPEIAGRIRAAGIRVAGMDLADVDVPLRLAGTRLTAEPSLRIGAVRIAAAGWLAWPSRPPENGWNLRRDLTLQFQVATPRVLWEDLDPWIPEAWRGRGEFSAAGTIAGSPGAWRASATVKADRLQGPRSLAIGGVQMRLRLDPQHLEVEALQATMQGVPLRARGRWEWDGTGTGEADLGPADLARLPFAPAQAEVSGSARARLHGTTGPRGLHATGAVTVQEAAVGAARLGDGRIEIALAQSDLALRLGFPALTLTGTVRGRLDAGQPFAVRVQADEMPLQPLLALGGRHPGVAVDGTLAFVADLVVPAAEPARLRGSLAGEKLRLFIAGDAWENREPIRLRWEAGRLFLDRMTLSGPLGQAALSGSLQPGGQLDLTVRGRLPLAMLPTFAPAVREASGTLDVRLHLGGSSVRPALQGEGTLRAERIVLAESPEALRDVEAAFLVTPEALRILRATGAFGRSRLQASGDLALEGGRPGAYRFAITGREVPFAPLEGLQTLWDLDLELVGAGSAPQLRGQGRLLRGAYTGDFSLLGMLLARKTSGAAAPVPAVPLQLRLTLDDALTVRTNLARMQVGGSLRVEGTTADPILFGALEARDGQLLFRRHRFTVEYATARFTDPRAIDPVLHITARSRVAAYDVVMAIRGSVRDLTIRLTSNPPLSQEEVVALLTTGSPALKAGQAAQGLLAEEFGQLLLQDVLGVVLDSSGLMHVQAGLDEGAEGQRVQVGAQVAEGVRVLYWQTLSGGTKRTLRVEYQLLGPLLIAGEQDFQGGYGGDVLLRLRFR